MCGIVGVLGARPAAPLLLDALQRLEYRGYDSAGIATLANGHIERRRAPGKLANLAAVLAGAPMPGTTGVGHTRWATHGAPTETNAHPHGTARVSVVHNGIIENHAALREELEAAGQVFETETDTETVAQLLDLHLHRGMPPVEAAQATLGAAGRRLRAGHGVRRASRADGRRAARRAAGGRVRRGRDVPRLRQPGAGAADPAHRLPARRRLGGAGPRRRDASSTGRAAGAARGAAHRPYRRRDRQGRLPPLHGEGAARAPERHRPGAAAHDRPGDPHRGHARPAVRPGHVPRATVTACGSAFYAGLVGRHWLEAEARLPCDADVASELRYRDPPLPPGGLALLVSQSGETADTLAALRSLRGAGQHVLSVLNVPESTMARESDAVLETLAGPEIGVASTKAFTAQLTTLACFAIAAGRARGAMSAAREAELVDALLDLPSRAADALALDMSAVAERVAQARDVLFLGRGALLPDRDGGRAEAEGDQLHPRRGLRGRRDEARPDRADRPRRAGGGRRAERAAVREDRVQPAGGRGARRQADGVQRRGRRAKLRGIAAETVVLPAVDPFVAPILYAIPVQMLAYQVAVLKGTDVDQPRNLAKSVTVE